MDWLLVYQICLVLGVIGFVVFIFYKTFKKKKAKKQFKQDLEKGNYEQAMKSKQKSIDSFKEEFNHLMDKEDYVNALRIGSKIKTENDEMLLKIGLCYLKNDNLNAAKSCFERVLKITYYFSDRAGDIGEYYIDAGLYTEAIKVLQQIEEDDIKFMHSMDNYHVIKNLGYAFFKKDMYDIAIEKLKKAPINKKSPNKELNSIIALIGECYDNLGNKTQALKFYKKAISNDIGLDDVLERIKALEAQE